MNSPKQFFSFDKWGNECLEHAYVKRKGELRMGDYLLYPTTEQSKYVILGIQECCGPLANNGRTGAQNAFPSFINSFLNTQVYDGFPGKKTSILGQIIELNMDIESNPSQKVLELDLFLEEILTENLLPGQIPIVVGGGHNNALALIRWSAKNNKIAVINVDAHADLRSTEQRHSGNSFSTALEEGSLFHYSVLGLHEAYNNEYIRIQLLQDSIFHCFYESYLFGKRQLTEDIANILRHFNSDTIVGLEIDMDAIAYMPSSALSPSGWTLDQVRTFVHQFKQEANQIAYFNLTESAPNTEEERLLVGKALSYLVRDFISA